MTQRVRSCGFGLLLVIAAAGLPVGCSSGTADVEPRPGEIKGLLPVEVENRAEAVRADPRAYLHQVADNCRALDCYTLAFTRYERRGFFQRLYGPEHIRCRFRHQPFSVHMKWLDRNTKHDEVVYVTGQADDKVRFVTRWWIPTLKPPPGVNRVSLSTPVSWGESRRPLTDFGLHRMMERTLAAIRTAGDDVIISYRGPLQLPADGRTVHHIHIEVPASQNRVPIQELYVDVATDLPAGTILKRHSGTLDAAYFYAELNTDLALTDDDFLLPAERQAAEQTQPEPTSHDRRPN